LSSNVTAWVLALAVLATQALCFTFFIDAASLDFGDDRIWIYAFSCPQNNLDCQKTSDLTSVGWIFLTVFALVYLVCDIWSGLKLVWGVSKHGVSMKSFRVFIGGCSLLSITSLALYATVVYNFATSRSTLDMIFNTVILLFVNDLDEKLFTSLHVISPNWLERITTEIATNFKGRVRINIRYAASNHELRHEHKVRIAHLEHQMAQRSITVKRNKAKIKKLQKKMAKLEKKQGTSRREIRRVDSQYHEQDRRVLALEEKVAVLEADQVEKNEEMKKDKAMNQNLQSELKNLRADVETILLAMQH